MLRCRRQLRLKTLEVKNEEEYRLMLASDEDALYAPWFFTWVEDNKLAAFAWPQTRGNLEFLWEEVAMYYFRYKTHRYALSRKNTPLANSKFEWTFIPVKECESPTIEQIFKFIRVVQWCRKKNLPLGVHCRMGLGRTGVLVAVYLMYFHGMAADQALKNLRYLRPGSVDSPAQVECIRNYRPSAKMANDKRISKITFQGSHFLDILKGDVAVTKEGVWGLPRIWLTEKNANEDKKCGMGSTHEIY
ncbi:hypothetical protein NQ317_013384 [Molorchus minor]|uniref:Tyrosine specific protein phosphatases domain-containing protein n=1 Tax=Molorchus minor TaxID=1323400 RepID=A0ABQ9JLG8_9CUCU|nr:hypothetical protein NQ317_013384 [Molorchus minor]